jgi:hypothetical protein
MRCSTPKPFEEAQTVSNILSSQILPIVLIVFGGIVALIAPVIESFASPEVAHSRKIMLVFGGLAVLIALMGMLLAIHMLLD